MSKTFISYRRDDSKWQAREIYRALTLVVPREHVFMDIDSIPPGADFVEVLEGWVEQCDIMLVLIGVGWIDAMDPKTGRRRLDNVNDFVRIEVRKGLTRGIPVVPVLIDGAPIPDQDGLPDDLKRLVRRNAEFVEHRTVDSDVARLIRRLGLGAPSGSAQPLVPPRQPVSTPAPAPEAGWQAEGRIRIEAKLIHGAPKGADGAGWLLPGNGRAEWFRDHAQGPEMVVIPAGHFMMGSPESEPERIGKGHRFADNFGIEEPRHRVTFDQPFAVGRGAVTVDEYAVFVTATGHKMPDEMFTFESDKWETRKGRSWRNPGFAQTGRHPVVGASWDDAAAYTKWLSQVTGKSYRLLSEAEWEYACRAGTETPFWWGTEVTPEQANYNGNYVYPAGGAKGAYRKATLPVDYAGDKFLANPWGLHQLHGNVWEWCADTFHPSYEGGPIDGSAWTIDGDASRRVVRGGSWYDPPGDLRSASRFWDPTGGRVNYRGFRVGRTF